MLIDTHCHLDDRRYDEDLDLVIQRAIVAGVNGILLSGANPSDLEKAREISYKYDNIFYSAGAHPYHLDEYDQDLIEKHLDDPRCIAVGECGLDYYRLPENENEKVLTKALQKDTFIKQIELAHRYNKPLIIHIRDASFDSLNILREYSKKYSLKGVLHCFNASEILLELSEYGFYFGIGGVLTFSNAKLLVEILPKIPIDKILLETDAPYLTPHPHRGKRNEPAYMVNVLEKMSDILNIKKSELEIQIEKNTKNLFLQFF